MLFSGESEACAVLAVSFPSELAVISEYWDGKEWGGAPEGGFPPKGVVAALPTTPPVGLDGDRGACPRSLLEQRWGRTAGVAMRTCIDQSVC